MRWRSFGGNERGRRDEVNDLQLLSGSAILSGAEIVMLNFKDRKLPTPTMLNCPKSLLVAGVAFPGSPSYIVKIIICSCVVLL